MNNLKTGWLINGLLLAILALLTSNLIANRGLNAAHAEGGGWETNGITVATTRAANEQVVLIDTKKRNIMIYSTPAIGLLNLTGVRSFKYDMELKDDMMKKGMGNGATYEQAKRAAEAANR